MAFSFTRPVTWLPGPVGNTEVTSERLNAMQDGIGTQVVAVDSAKPDRAEVRLRGAAGFAPLKAALSGGVVSSCLNFLGDSTLNEQTEGAYLFAQSLATQYPGVTVRYGLFSDTTQRFGPFTVLHTGPGGARRSTFINGTSNTLQIPAGDIPEFSADLDIAVCASMADWTPTAVRALAARYGAAGNRAWRLYINTSGRPVLEWSNDGTTLLSAIAGAGVPVADGASLWVRVTLDVDAGSSTRVATFYTSTDGATWTQLGATAGGANTSVYSGCTNPWELGGRTGALDVIDGSIYEVQIRQGIDGPLIAPCLPEFWPPATNLSPSPEGSPILTVANASVAGKDLVYLSDPTRLPKMIGRWGSRAVVLSCSHNDNQRRGSNYIAAWRAWIAAVKALAPSAPCIPLLENPRIAPANWVFDQDARHYEIQAMAAADGMDSIDVWQAFRDDPRGLAALLEADGVHPNVAAGNAIVAAVIGAKFAAA